MSKCVSLTLGPGGKNVLLNTAMSQDQLATGRAPLNITKDGVTVAKSLTSYSPNSRL